MTKQKDYPWSPAVISGYREAIRKLDELCPVPRDLLDAPEPHRSRAIRSAQNKLYDIVHGYRVSREYMRYYANWHAEHATKATSEQNALAFKIMDDVCQAVDNASRRVALLTYEAPVLDYLADLHQLILDLERDRDNDDVVVALSSLARALRREPTVENHEPVDRFIARLEADIIPALRDSDMRVIDMRNTDLSKPENATMRVADICETGLALFKQTVLRK